LLNARSAAVAVCLLKEATAIAFFTEGHFWMRGGEQNNQLCVGRYSRSGHSPLFLARLDTEISRSKAAKALFNFMRL
jgi:hypothetical protein